MNDLPSSASPHAFHLASETSQEADPERLRDPARLAALERTGLMDTAAEAPFDRAVRLATRILGTPVGLLSLVDGERQFFKAQQGLTEPVASARETPLTHSFCQHVVDAGAALVVRDARQDPLLRNNLAIPDLGVIAYLGVPVRGPDGAVLGSFCAIQSEPRDWTHAECEALEDIAAGIETEIALRAEVARARDAETRVTKTKERFRMALRAGQVGTYHFDPVRDAVDWDDELFAIWGISRDAPDLFGSLKEAIHPDDRAMWEADVATSLDPNGSGAHDVEMRIVRPDTGEVRWVQALGQTTFEGGRAVRMLGTARDITARKEAEAREKLLTRELNHRVKNLFAVVSGMISLTARTSTTPKEMGASLRSRVLALARAHALIQPAVTGEDLTTTQVTLQTLASAVLEPYAGAANAVSLSGPPVQLSPNAASSLSLVLHELATNAAKYGALSVPGGQLAVEWHMVGDGGGAGDERLHLAWVETGGPTIAAPPDRRGFGSKLIDMTVNGQMGGSLGSDWHADGVRHEMSMPLSRLRETARAH